MQALVNKAYGYFQLPKEFLEQYPQFVDKKYTQDQEDRVNPELIQAVEEYGPDKMLDIKIVYVPDNVTDWELDENDGFETIIYVQNGKLGRV